MATFPIKQATGTLPGISSEVQQNYSTSTGAGQVASAAGNLAQTGFNTSMMVYQKQGEIELAESMSAASSQVSDMFLGFETNQDESTYGKEWEKTFGKIKQSEPKNGWARQQYRKAMFNVKDSIGGKVQDAVTGRVNDKHKATVSKWIADARFTGDMTALENLTAGSVKNGTMSSEDRDLILTQVRPYAEARSKENKSNQAVQLAMGIAEAEGLEAATNALKQMRDNGTIPVDVYEDARNRVTQEDTFNKAAAIEALKKAREADEEAYWDNIGKVDKDGNPLNSKDWIDSTSWSGDEKTVKYNAAVTRAEKVAEDALADRIKSQQQALNRTLRAKADQITRINFINESDLDEEKKAIQIKAIEDSMAADVKAFKAQQKIDNELAKEAGFERARATARKIHSIGQITTDAIDSVEASDLPQKEKTLLIEGYRADQEAKVKALEAKKEAQDRRARLNEPATSSATRSYMNNLTGDILTGKKTYPEAMQLFSMFEDAGEIHSGDVKEFVDSLGKARDDRRSEAKATATAQGTESLQKRDKYLRATIGPAIPTMLLSLDTKLPDDLAFQITSEHRELASIDLFNAFPVAERMNATDDVIKVKVDELIGIYSIGPSSLERAARNLRQRTTATDTARAETLDAMIIELQDKGDFTAAEVKIQEGRKFGLPLTTDPSVLKELKGNLGE